MKAARCIKCGRLLHDPVSIARGMGPACAGDTGGHRKKYHLSVCSRRDFAFTTAGNSNAASPTVFTLTEEIELQGEPAIVDEIDYPKSRPAEVLMKYPTDLAALVLSAPAPARLVGRSKNIPGRKSQGVVCIQAGFCRTFVECALI